VLADLNAGFRHLFLGFHSFLGDLNKSLLLTKKPVLKSWTLPCHLLIFVLQDSSLLASWSGLPVGIKLECGDLHLTLKLDQKSNANFSRQFSTHQPWLHQTIPRKFSKAFRDLFSSHSKKYKIK
jgi:hypothetical protein